MGPSNIVLLSKLGSQIDTHQLILRTDAAPAAGYEAYVGSSTDIRVQNLAMSSAAKNKNNNNLDNEHKSRKAHSLLWSVSRKSVRSYLQELMHAHSSSHNDKLPLILHPSFGDYMEDNFAFQPGSDLYAVMIGLHVCRSVTVYGLIQLPAMQGMCFFDVCHFIAAF